MREKYERSVSHLIVKRRNKISSAPVFEGKSEEESFPVEPSSSLFYESDSSSYYEGGKEEFKYQPRSTSMQTKKSQNQRINKVDITNQIIINKAPKLNRARPKIDTVTSQSNKLTEAYNSSKSYSKAVDLYFEDHSSLFWYQGYDESMEPDEPEYDAANYMNIEDDFRIDEYVEGRPEDQRTWTLNYIPVPAIDGMNYMPPPFRHDYEICIWKIDTHNSAKIKQNYFTPEVCEQFNQ